MAPTEACFRVSAVPHNAAHKRNLRSNGRGHFPIGRAPRARRPRSGFSTAPRAVLSDGNQDRVLLPIDYAKLLGLGNRELCSESHIQRAHDALAEEELEAGYSPLARLGRDKLLYAAREGLRSARGRVRTLAPDIAIEPLLLPGALALLQQVGAYDLVVEAAAAAPASLARGLRGASREDEREWGRDVALATALAHCGRARRALEAGGGGGEGVAGFGDGAAAPAPGASFSPPDSAAGGETHPAPPSPGPTLPGTFAFGAPGSEAFGGASASAQPFCLDAFAGRGGLERWEAAPLSASLLSAATLSGPSLDSLRRVLPEFLRGEALDMDD
uniref:Plastid division protein CDP1-like 1st alpha solenoid domain-containing protein n=1 Tax=Auxenochlorella protothecoides TaxID=3075 RepID=A0A1D2AC58_AUXPR